MYVQYITVIFSTVQLIYFICCFVAIAAITEYFYFCYCGIPCFPLFHHSILIIRLSSPYRIIYYLSLISYNRQLYSFYMYCEQCRISWWRVAKTNSSGSSEKRNKIRVQLQVYLFQWESILPCLHLCLIQYEHLETSCQN